MLTRDFYSPKVPVEKGMKFIVNDIRIKDASKAEYGINDDPTRLPFVFMYGTLENGNSLCAIITDFQPYMDIFDMDHPYTKSSMESEVERVNSGEWFGGSGHQITSAALHMKNLFIDHTHKFWRTRRYPFARYYFDSLDSERFYQNCLRKRVREKGIHTYFGNSSAAVQHEIKFLTDSDINSAGWNEIVGDFKIAECKCIATQHVIVLPSAGIRKIDCTLNDPSLMFSFDIECIGDSAGHFPHADHEDNEIICIGCSFHLQASRVPLRSIMFATRCYEGDDQPDEKDSGANAEIIYCSDEKDLLARFCGTIMSTDADVLLHYNGNSFDIPYIFTRLDVLGMEVYKVCFSKNTREAPRIWSKRVEKNSFKGKVNVVDIVGRFNSDVFVFITKDVTIRLGSYTLDSVLREFTTITKDKIKVDEDLIKFYRKRDKAGMLIVYKYCFKDVLGCVHLNHNLNIALRQRELATLSYVPLNMMVTRGEGIRALGSIYRAAATLKHWVIRAKNDCEFDEFYELAGAHIDTPVPGFYDKDVIVVVDFNSLYPSIIIDRGISPDRLVTNDDEKAYLEEHKIPCFKVKIDDKTRDDLSREHWFISTDYEPSDPQQKDRGIMPMICQHGLEMRAAVRKMMKQYKKGEFVYSVLDSRQQAIKVDNNSKYGVLGTTTVIMYSPECAESITASGRELNKMCNASVSAANGRGVYGDTDSKFVAFRLLEGLTVEQSCSQMFKLGEKLCRDIEYHALKNSPRSSQPEIAEALLLFEQKHDDAILNKYKSIRMGVDKMLYPTLISDKKKDYKYYERKEDGSKGSYKSVGGAQVRRNVPPVIQALHKEMCQYVLDHAGMDRLELFKYLLDSFGKKCIDILSGKIAFDQFVISCSVGELEDYDDPEKLVNAMAVKRQIERGVGEVPHAGDRINYVYMRPDKLFTDKKTGKAREPRACDMSELVEYVKENNKQIWYEYYVNHMSNDVTNILALVVNSLLPSNPTYKQHIAFCELIGIEPCFTKDKWKKLDDARKLHVSQISEYSMKKILARISELYGDSSRMHAMKNLMNKRLLKAQPLPDRVAKELKSEALSVFMRFRKIAPKYDGEDYLQGLNLYNGKVDKMMRVIDGIVDKYIRLLSDEPGLSPSAETVEAICAKKMKTSFAELEALKNWILAWKPSAPAAPAPAPAPAETSVDGPAASVKKS